MSSRSCAPLALATLIALAAGPASAQQITLDASGVEIVALSGLSKADDCPSAASKGRVVKRDGQPGRPLAAFTFRDVKYGESYINVPETDWITDAAKRKRVDAAIDAMVVPGRQLSLTVKGCGAAGRIEMLDAIAPVGPAAAPAAAKTRWRFETFSAVQKALLIASADKKFSLTVNCRKTAMGTLYYSTYFMMPRSWSPRSERDVVTIDGAMTAMELDGADEGLVLSDTLVDNTAALSDDMRKRMAEGGSLVVAGVGKGRKPQDARFDISNGRGLFADFERRCGDLPTR